MPQKDRQTLKKLFKNGSLPTESSFEDIIDSSINKIDDGLSKSMKNGLMLSPIGKARSMLSFFKKITDKDPQWSLDLKENTTDQESKYALNFVNHQDQSIPLSLSDKVGINNQAPQYPLDVKGFVAAGGRIGTAATRSTAPADGNWHTIIDELMYCTAFEVMARVGVHKTGKHAILHAIALSAYGDSHAKIKHHHARFSFWLPIHIKLRWVGTTYHYALQIKTSKDLGTNVNIKYHLTQLWDDEEMGAIEHYKEI